MHVERGGGLWSGASGELSIIGWMDGGSTIVLAWAQGRVVGRMAEGWLSMRDEPMKEDHHDDG